MAADVSAGPGELIVDVVLSTVNRGERTRLQGAKQGTVYGWDVLGRVSAATAAPGYPAGATVVGLALDGGGWAERVALRARDVALVPAAMIPTAAVSVPVAGVTALRALRHAPDLLGRDVAVLGATGAVGHFAIQLASMAGARVTAVTRDPGRAAGLAALGAVDVLAVEQVPAATFDLVLDCVGGDETAAAVRACRPAGRVVIVGNLRPASGALTPALIVAAGAWVCGYRLTEHARDMPVGQDIAMLLHWIGQGTLAAPPMHTVSWTDQPAVERALADAFHPARAVLRIADDTAGDTNGGPAPEAADDTAGDTAAGPHLEATGGPARNAPRTQSRARRTPMTSWQVVDDDGVRTATIDRPPVNALSIAALRELDAVVSGVEDDLTVRVLVLTGAGSRFFVAGADIGEAAATPPERAGERTALGQRVLARIAALPLPVIAAVNGLALGGGCELALAADIRLASTSARFGQPEVRLGIMPGFGGSQRLPRLIGMGRALDMLLSGRQVDAAAALDMGLVSQLFEADELHGGCAAYARRLRALAPDALAAIKQAAREGAGTGLQAGLELEVSLSNRLRLSRDAQEGLRAFVDKRNPVFRSTRTAPGARPV